MSGGWFPRYSYKQRKFNLFREESEGYAKLLVELNNEQADSSPEEMLEVIKAIIGRSRRRSVVDYSITALSALLSHFVQL